MNQEQISKVVETWIAEEELPMRANLKVVRKFDGLYPEDDEEREAYWDFIHWAMTYEHRRILSVKVRYEWKDIDFDELRNLSTTFGHSLLKITVAVFCIPTSLLGD